MRLRSSESENYFYDWSLGLDVGVGLQYGSFHAGIGGGARSQIFIVLAAILYTILTQEPPERLETKVFGTTGSGTPESVEDTQICFDFPVRCYFGFDLFQSCDVFLDAFLERYYRVSDIKDLPSAQDFEAGITFGCCGTRLGVFFLEASYIWPQTNLIRLTLGLYSGL